MLHHIFQSDPRFVKYYELEFINYTICSRIMLRGAQKCVRQLKTAAILYRSDKNDRRIMMSV